MRSSRPPKLTDNNVLAAGAFALLALCTGCGNAAFVASGQQDQQDAPGTFTIPAKVDVLLVEQDLGKMTEAYPEISSQMPGFLSQIQGEGWDYHFATIPLTTYRALSQVVASQYDSNWGSQWIAPFPGAAPDGPGTIPPQYFSTPGNYQGFLTPANIDLFDADNSREPGFQNITTSLQTFQNQNPNTNFIRSDAMLAVIVVSAGEDTSLVNYCPRSGDGLMIPCDDIPNAVQCSQSQMLQSGPGSGLTCASGQESFNYFQSQLLSLKPAGGLVHFFSVVANEELSNEGCLGGNSYFGARYEQMSQSLGDPSYDLCSGADAVPNALSGLSQDLQSVRLSLRTHYLLLSQAPDVNTIVVTRSDGTVIPEDPHAATCVSNPSTCTNGWTYVGFVTAYQIDFPEQMNQFSSYAIQLNGTAELTGSESATVSYTPQGLQNSN